jgi:hypothetical protein
LRAKLAAASAVTSVVSTRIYNTQAPLEAALPYIVVALQAGGSTNRSPRDEFDLVLLVKCVAADGLQAGTVADAIRAALHEQAITLDSPWNAMDCQHETAFQFVENEDRAQYWHAGGLYRLRAVE